MKRAPLGASGQQPPREATPPTPTEDGTPSGVGADAALSELDLRALRAFAAYAEAATALTQQQRSQRTPLAGIVSDHLAADAAALPVTVEQVPDHRLVDLDIAMNELADATKGRVLGVSGGEQKQHQSLVDLLSNAFMAFDEAPVDYGFRSTGPHATRSVVTFGLWLLQHDGAPLAVLVRAAAPQYGRSTAQLEFVCARPDAVASFQARLRTLMIERSVLRGQVLSFQPTEWGASSGATFVERPDVAAGDVILPDGVLHEVTRHVVGIAEHRDTLLAAGQHLKRGVLLYGPPGTGKTLTVRHLLSVTEGTTAILLTGSSIHLVTEAAELARTFSPSIVVMEDIDLVAAERGQSPQPLLFEVLDALDGLDGDADVAFLMTTNRIRVLERALAQRPGRVDLAVEIGLPAEPEQRRLLDVYARGLGFGEESLQRAAELSEGTTGSFAKELIRRAVLLAAEAGERLGDEHLDAALDGLLAAGATLTRRLLGADAGHEDERGDDSLGIGVGAEPSGADALGSEAGLTAQFREE